MSAPLKSWLKAFRLRTLPLSLSTIAMGSILAAAAGTFSWLILALCVTTTLFLQILSNLANDYGDTEHGADNAERVGPSRAVQSGEISMAAMKKAMYLFGFLALVSGVALISVSLGSGFSKRSVFFFLLGLGAIAAAVKYTAGKNPYGYRGLGDIFVFLFFGIVGVAGTYYLQTKEITPDIFLPAISIGFLCAGVLNVNNMRDRISDANSGKITIAVRLGATNSKYYHLALISFAWVAIVVYTLLNFHSPTQFIFLITLPLFAMHLAKILGNKEPALLDGQLKTLVLSTLAYCITFGISTLLNK